MAIIIVAISVSMIALMLEVQPNLRDQSLSDVSNSMNLSIGQGLYSHFYRQTMPPAWTTYMDFICVIILTVDYICRWIVSINRCKFFAQPFNILDLLGILPVWICFGFVAYGDSMNWTKDQWLSITAFTYFEMTVVYMRLLRIFRFRLILFNFRSLRVITLAYKHSLKELCILSTLLMMSSIVYGVLVFYVEIFNEKTDSFPSGFHAQWWAFVTMTTVGYGDYVPHTNLGYVIAVTCSLFGIVLVAMTTTIIINNFMQIYTNVEIIERKNKYLKSDDKENYMEETVC